MKNISGMLILTTATLISCTNDIIDSKTDGCADMVYVKVNNHSISETDLAIVTNLFTKNKIPFDNLRFTKFNDKDDLNSSSKYYVHITADQFTNELPIFFSSIGFHFLNGAFYLSIGNRYNSITKTLDTLRNFSPSTVRGLFMEEIRNHKMNESNYINDCLRIQFGYVDLNGGSSTLTPGNLEKAWFVRPKNETYPEAIFLDGEETTYYFFDGVVTVGG